MRDREEEEEAEGFREKDGEKGRLMEGRRRRRARGIKRKGEGRGARSGR